ncbi:MAG: serine/threonine-protein phosphatase, partial [Spirochaetia bacterium]|nr:serine/threonine-protein phosphatase [Spirochaetia bacterium]
DIFPLSHDETGIFLGDVSGHGLPAALITIMIKSYLASRQAESRDDISNSLLYSPCDLLTGLNESLSSHLDTEFVSAFYGIFNKKTRTLIYKSAGHPPPFYIVKNSSGVTELKFMKMKPQLRLLGPIFNMLNDPKPENSEITFPPETRVVFYSDGLFDAVDYDYVKSEDGIPSFSTTFISEWFDDLYSITADEWAGKLSELLYLNRDRWVVDDDISAVFLDIE